jgi:hypothetical protein
MGMALLQQFAGAAAGGTSGEAGVGGPPAGAVNRPAVVRDERTGETYLKVPMPKTEVLVQALKKVSTLLESLRK